MALDLEERLIIEGAAQEAASKMAGNPEYISHLAANLALYLPRYLRAELVQNIAAIDDLLHNNRYIEDKDHVFPPNP
jgi:hypothetical protein